MRKITNKSRPIKKTYRDKDGFIPLESYGVLGDGRSVALSACDGSIDWWCVPYMDSAPLFDRLVNDAEAGGYFLLQPVGNFKVERAYRDNSNVLETLYTTAKGKARVTESLNSGPAGRLPWSELGRRIECLEGAIEFRIKLIFGRCANTINPYFSQKGKHELFHADRLLGLFIRSEGVSVDLREDGRIEASVALKKGQKETIGLVAGQDEPLVVPPIAELDKRIDRSDAEWKDWARNIAYPGEQEDLVLRNALVLKLLLFSPTGAIAAAATTSLPEKIGGKKNWDYRYAWVRDAAYTIKAFLRVGVLPESQAAFKWLLKRLREEGPHVCYTLEGNRVPPPENIEVSGYKNSLPVVRGNRAGTQLQLGVFGDIFETACRFVEKDGLLDSQSAETLASLADFCAEKWRAADSGIWELEESRQYTNSKISCWQALARAVELADSGQLPTTCRDRWERERDRVKDWINENCWSEKLGAYEFYPGSGALDCSVALAVRFGFGGGERLARTLDALDKKLGAGPFHYRYSGMAKEEGCFLACSFWIAEARALLGQKKQAKAALDRLVKELGGIGVFSEMIDPKTKAYLGNMPQGLTHLAMLQAAATIDGIVL